MKFIEKANAIWKGLTQPKAVRRVGYAMGHHWKRTVRGARCILAAQILILSLMFTTIASVSHAASVELSSNPGCAIELRGDIVEGDAIRLETLLSQQKLVPNGSEDVWETNTQSAVCLDSHGGNWLEGMKTAELVHDSKVTTRILANGNCFSACATIFMAGRVTAEDDDSPSRFMHVTAHLGFHAPYLRPDDSTIYSAKDIEEITRTQSLVTAAFLQFASFHSEFSFQQALPTSLVIELLASGPDQLAMVDTIDYAARWGVGLEGLNLPGRLSPQQIRQLCRNMEAWAADKSAIIKTGTERNDQLDALQLKNLHTTDGNKSFWLVDTGGMEVQNCLIGAQPEVSDTQTICIKDDFTGRHLGDCAGGVPYLVPSWYAYDPATKLSSLVKKT